jgi:hypothetical protein
MAVAAPVAVHFFLAVKEKSSIEQLVENGEFLLLNMDGDVAKYVKMSIILEVIIKQRGFCSHCSGGKENWHRWLSMG